MIRQPFQSSLALALGMDICHIPRIYRILFPGDASRGGGRGGGKGIRREGERMEGVESAESPSTPLLSSSLSTSPTSPPSLSRLGRLRRHVFSPREDSEFETRWRRSLGVVYGDVAVPASHSHNQTRTTTVTPAATGSIPTTNTSRSARPPLEHDDAALEKEKWNISRFIAGR